MVTTIRLGTPDKVNMCTATNHWDLHGKFLSACRTFVVDVDGVVVCDVDAVDWAPGPDLSGRPVGGAPGVELEAGQPPTPGEGDVAGDACRHGEGSELRMRK